MDDTLIDRRNLLAAGAVLSVTAVALPGIASAAPSAPVAYAPQPVPD